MTTTTALGEATVAELRSAVAGTVIVPGDPDYESARRTWNHAIDRYPAMIMRCSGTADVVAAVRFARSEGLPIAVRGGAHSLAGFSTCDDGLVLDLSHMRAVHVDARAGRARAQGGTTWKQFDRETQLYGLATTGGLVSIDRARRIHARRRDRALGYASTASPATTSSRPRSSTPTARLCEPRPTRTRSCSGRYAGAVGTSAW